MTLWRDPRVLSDEWCPPALLGREEELRQLREVLPLPFHAHPQATVVLSGPRGSGTSALAYHFARSVLDGWRNRSGREPPLLLRVDASQTRNPSRTAAALFREIDPSVHGRGLSTEVLILLLLRRLRTLRRPAVIWLDQLRAPSGELHRVVGPLASPETLLPEGREGLPPLAVVVSGEVDPLSDDPWGRGGAAPGAAARAPGSLRLSIDPLPPAQILEALDVRARLAFDLPPAPGTLGVVRELLLNRGWGLTAAGAVLEESGRRALARGGDRLEMRDVVPPWRPCASHRVARVMDECLLGALYEVASRHPDQAVSLSELRPALRERCRARGVPEPTGGRLWRHLVALEQVGALRRDVRLGGLGGTRTLVGLPRVDRPAPAPAAPPAPEGHPTHRVLPGDGGEGARGPGVEPRLTRPTSGPRPAGPAAVPPPWRSPGPDGPAPTGSPT